MSNRDQAILRRMMADIPSDGHVKQAGANDLEVLMSHALGNMTKTAAEEEEEEEKKKARKEQDLPVDDEGEEEEDAETKEVLASIGRAFIDQYGYQDEGIAKVAAAAYAADQEFMSKTAAAAYADELAKIAYVTGAGMTFEEYMEKVSSIGGVFRSAAGGIADAGRAVGRGVATGARGVAGAGRAVGGGIATGARGVAGAGRAVGGAAAGAGRAVGRGAAGAGRAVGRGAAATGRKVNQSFGFGSDPYDVTGAQMRNRLLAAGAAGAGGALAANQLLTGVGEEDPGAYEEDPGVYEEDLQKSGGIRTDIGKGVSNLVGAARGKIKGSQGTLRGQLGIGQHGRNVVSEIGEEAAKKGRSHARKAVGAGAGVLGATGAAGYGIGASGGRSDD